MVVTVTLRLNQSVTAVLGDRRPVSALPGLCLFVDVFYIFRGHRAAPEPVLRITKKVNVGDAHSRAVRLSRIRSTLQIGRVHSGPDYLITAATWITVPREYGACKPNSPPAAYDLACLARQVICTCRPRGSHDAHQITYACRRRTGPRILRPAAAFELFGCSVFDASLSLSSNGQHARLPSALHDRPAETVNHKRCIS